MNFDRFAFLAGAYGGDFRRWPLAEQEAARNVLHAHPDAPRTLAAAAELDAVLGSWTVQPPGAALHARIAAAATRRRDQVRRLRLWFSGLGAAAALAGGVAAGIGVVGFTHNQAEQAPGSLYELSVLGAPLDLPESADAGGAAGSRL